jgi:hypothetical protein
MPVNIYADDDSKTEVAWLCDDNWDLATQVSALEAWLQESKAKISPARYIADIGFSVRPDATGGGAAIAPEMMRCMADLGISLFLSEYPRGEHVEPDERAKA